MNNNISTTLLSYYRGNDDDDEYDEYDEYDDDDDDDDRNIYINQHFYFI